MDWTRTKLAYRPTVAGLNGPICDRLESGTHKLESCKWANDSQQRPNCHYDPLLLERTGKRNRPLGAKSSLGPPKSGNVGELRLWPSERPTSSGSNRLAQNRKPPQTLWSCCRLMSETRYSKMDSGLPMGRLEMEPRAFWRSLLAGRRLLSRGVGGYSFEMLI